MPKITVIARLVARSDCVEAVKTELLKLIVPTRQESGCIEYNLHQDNDNPALFVFYETWESLPCLEAHMNTEHFKSYATTIIPMLEEKIVHKMTRIA